MCALYQNGRAGGRGGRPGARAGQKGPRRARHLANVHRHRPEMAGADAVSVHVNLGSETESEMLQELGEISETCSYWGIPLLAMMYPRGQKVENEHDVELVKHAARVGSELGVDIVKTNYTGDPDSFKEVVEGALVPVVIAGGPKVDTDEELLQMVKDSIEVGGAGVAFGRNLFQAENPGKITKAISEVVHNDLEVNEALKFLK